MQCNSQTGRTLSRTRSSCLGRSAPRQGATVLHEGWFHLQASHAPGTHCRAQDDRGADSTDWDSAWRSFQKQVRSQVDTQEPVARQSPSVRPLPPRSSQDQLRQQERVLLDLWTSEDALKWGSMALMAGLLTVIIASGPPLDDGRCTLPWC